MLCCCSLAGTKACENCPTKLTDNIFADNNKVLRLEIPYDNCINIQLTEEQIKDIVEGKEVKLNNGLVRVSKG